MNLRNAILPIVVAAALFAPVAVMAQGPGNFVGGSVTAVDAAKKTVTVQGFGQDAPQSFKVGASTKYDQSVTGAISDLKVGDKVRVMGQPSEDDDNTIDARAIMLVPPGAEGMGFGRRGGNRPGGGAGRPGGGGGQGAGGGQGGGRGGRRGVMGTIATLTPKFTVTSDDDKSTKTIDTTDETRIMVSKPAAFGDIAVGKMVFANMDNGTAKQVRIMPAFGRRGGGGGGGFGRRGGGGGGGGN